MKASFSWLKELVETDQNVEAIAESLSISGFEVEEINDLSEGMKGVVVGFVEDIAQHPNADKLKICQVQTGLSKPLQIVCGASNVKKGFHVLVATVGAELKAIGLKIKKSELRGVPSEGMICSLEELGLESKADGIALLEDMGVAIPEIGSAAKTILGMDDKILELAITANRPDGMSMVGLARELSAITRSTLTVPITEDLKIRDLFELQELSKDALDEHGIYSIHYIENVEGNKLAPKWMVERLKKAGIKSINAIIDITNYVMLEQGQPLHAFDSKVLNNIAGKQVNQMDFGVRRAKEAEQITCLDNNKYILDEHCHLVTCNKIPIAIAGVIGGQESAVNNSTKNIWLEAAVFTPKSVRITSRSIGLRTDSSARYEKGISSQITMKAVNRAIELYKEIFDCKVIGSWLNKDNIDLNQLIILRRSRIDDILGKIVVDNSFQHETDALNASAKIGVKVKRFLDINEIENCLSLLGCQLTTIKNGWEVRVPPNRSIDLKREIDLIEEVARIIGYDKFDSNLPNPIQPGGLTPKQIADRKIRNMLTSSGLQEVTTFSLVPEEKGNKEMVAITNPLLSDTSHLRVNLWEEHLNICSRNIAAGKDGCWLFEIGKIYRNVEGKIKEEDLLCGAICGDNSIEKWSSSGKPQELDYYDARGILQQLFIGLGLTIVDKPLSTELKRIHPGRSAEIYLEGRKLGIFGQVHPELVNTKEISRNTYIFELMLENIIEAATRDSKLKARFKEYPIVPSMERDIAFVVSKKYLCNELISTMNKAGASLLEKVNLIDKYESQNISSNEISLAFRLTFRKKKETLKESEINPTLEKIKSNLSQKYEVKFRE